MFEVEVEAFCYKKFEFQMLSFCTFMAHPVILIDLHENDFQENLDGARIYLLFAIVVHFGKLHIFLVNFSK